jgi:perosamine synthetase
MKIQRTIPPAAAPIDLKSIVHGLAGIFVGGKYINRLEDELRDYFGVKHVFLVSSGKAALTLILSALKSLCPDKEEVLIPAYTCFSVPSAILKAGLKISLCDTRDMDFNHELLELTVNKNTLCVVPTHLFGIPADMDKINNLRNRHGIFVVEDAAQAMDGKRQFGKLGDVGFFSLGRGKNITCGSGGIIITNSDTISSAIEKEYGSLERPGVGESLRKFLKVLILALFVRPSLYWFPAGLPFLKLGETIFYEDFPVKLLSGMQAGILNGWKGRLEKSARARQKNASYFIEALGLKGFYDCSVPFLRLPFMTESNESRNSILLMSRKKGMGVHRLYPVAVHEIDEIKRLFDGKAFPNANMIADRLLTIPTHEFLSDRDKEEICRLFSGTLDKQHINVDGVIQA